jgi:hypothetical protein
VAFVISTRFDLIRGYQITPALDIFARFCPETQVTLVITAPLAEVAVFAWVLLQARIILRDID